MQATARIDDVFAGQSSVDDTHEDRVEGHGSKLRRPAVVTRQDDTKTPTEDDVEVIEPDVIEPEEDADSEDGALSVDDLDPFGEPAPEGSASIPLHMAMVPVGVDADALVAADPLTAYLAHIRHIEPLSAEKQQKLAERFHNEGDVRAAQMLILSNVRLVVKIAREYRHQRESLMELIQEGNVGLAEAIRRYDPFRGVKFTSYAQYWIRAMILNYLMNVTQPLRIGSTRAGRKLFFNLNREREKLIRETQTQPSTRLLADRLGVEETEVVNVMRVIDAAPLSIHAPAPGYEKTTLGAVLSDEMASSPEEDVVQSDLKATVQAALDEFGETIDSDREKAIWFDRVLSDSPKSLQELGEEFGVSRERIRQVEVKIKRRLAAFLRDRFGDAAVELADATI
jgi:RNA polymerase sigma-32 factor